MEEKKQVIYRLSALENTDKNVRAACKKRFQRITKDYVLVYDEDIPKGGVEITADDLDALTRDDFVWLEKCNLSLIEEFVSSHEEVRKRSFKDFFEELDANLKEEREKAETEESDKEE